MACLPDGHTASDPPEFCREGTKQIKEKANLELTLLQGVTESAALRCPVRQLCGAKGDLDLSQKTHLWALPQVNGVNQLFSLG